MKPRLALTLGDVAGIGPEITAKTLLRHPALRDECVPVVIGEGITSNWPREIVRATNHQHPDHDTTNWVPHKSIA